MDVARHIYSILCFVQQFMDTTCLCAHLLIFMYYLLSWFYCLSKISVIDLSTCNLCGQELINNMLCNNLYMWWLDLYAMQPLVQKPFQYLDPKSIPTFIAPHIEFSCIRSPFMGGGLFWRVGAASQARSWVILGISLGMVTILVTLLLDYAFYRSLYTLI